MTKSQIENMVNYGRRTNWARAGIRVPTGKSKRAERIRDFMGRIVENNPTPRSTMTPQSWAWVQKNRRGLGIARMAEMFFDEHGSTRGDYRRTVVVDYVSPQITKSHPYHDHGHAGMTLITVTRTRRYARSYSYGPSTTTEQYLCGRNEAGTWYSHRVPTTITSVRSAVTWMWSGMEGRIITRQGDIALISGNGGPRIPASGLPAGHKIEGDEIRHETHPTIRIPGKHERVIVARRAAPRGDGAATQTRD